MTLYFIRRNNQFTGRALDLNWTKGIAGPFSERDAMRFNSIIGGKVLPYNGVSIEDVIAVVAPDLVEDEIEVSTPVEEEAEEATEDSVEEAEDAVVEEEETVTDEEVSYQDQIAEMKEAGFDYLEVTGGSRKAEDVQKAYDEFKG